MTRHMILKTDACALRSSFANKGLDEPLGLSSDPGFVVDPWTGQKILVGDSNAARQSRFRSRSPSEEF